MFKRWGRRNPIREMKLKCPQCDYSLEGHSGYAVTCPECGAMCDVRSMVDPQSGMRWTEVPGASDLLAPLWWLAGALVIALPVYGLWRGADAAATMVLIDAIRAQARIRSAD